MFCRGGGQAGSSNMQELEKVIAGDVENFRTIKGASRRDPSLESSEAVRASAALREAMAQKARHPKQDKPVRVSRRRK